LGGVATVINGPVRLLNSVGHALGAPAIPLYAPFIPLNGAAIMDTLLRVSAHQIFVDGFVQADPHGGNFLLLESSKIGLIDYGQVKQLTLHERLYLAKMVVAIGKGDKDRLKQLAIAGGYRSQKLDREVIWKMSLFALDRDGRDLTGDLNVQQFMDAQFSLDPWQSVNNAIIMPSRVSVLLRGIGLMLNHPVSVLSVWGPAAEKLLARHGLTYLDDQTPAST
jgi:aarF domain-containing kinase